MPERSDACTTELDSVRLELAFMELEKPVYNVVYRWLWNEADAADVVQEAFLRLWRMRNRVRPETLKPLLYRIAINLAANRKRSRRLWRWINIDLLGERAADQPEIDERLADRQVTIAVRRAVDALPERLRRIVMLCEFSDLTHTQIGEALGIAPGTVGSRRNAALKQLRALLTASVEGRYAH